MGNSNGSSSIGRGPAFGGNENHDGDPQRTTLGETAEQEAPAGNDLLGEAAPPAPTGVADVKPARGETPRK